MLEVRRAGSKLGVYLPKELASKVGLNKEKALRLSVGSKLGEATFLALGRPWITIPAAIVERLRLRRGQPLTIAECKIAPAVGRPKSLFADMRVDVLAVVPTRDRAGNEYVVDEYVDSSSERRLRIWYRHKRGSARQLVIKRYVDPLRFGMILGQIQAEGEKTPCRLAFKNRSICQHQDFVLSLKDLGVEKNWINARIVYNPRKVGDHELSHHTRLYVERTGIQIAAMDRSRGMRGTVVYETYVRSRILAEIILRAMSKIRKILCTSNSSTAPFLLLREGFVSELLAGDGSIDIYRRGRKTDVRVKISDGNRLYLIDYKKILARLGFRPRLSRQRAVMFDASLRDLFTLFSLRAFRGGHNWKKLLCAIGMALSGRQNRTYRRLERVSSWGMLTSVDLRRTEGISLEAARQWLKLMEKRGYMFRSRGFHGPRTPVGYSLTKHGSELTARIAESSEEIEKLKADMCKTDLVQILCALGPRSKQTAKA